MALLTPYHYTTLESPHSDSDKSIIPSTHFRLLVLDSGEAADEVSCSLEEHSLASAPEYEAISYVWGDPTETCYIICSGQQLAITKSLHSALRRFRFTSQKRTLWADAICISQQDLGERSAQVSIMCKIYSQACQVLIWLGPETDHDSEALNSMSQLQTILPTPPPITGELNALCTPEFLFRLIDSIPQSSWLQIRDLLQRPWFRRVWVIQEVLVAHSAQLFNGSKSIAWFTFAEVAEKILSFNLLGFLNAIKPAMSALQNICIMRPENSELRKPFFNLLCHAREFKSTDPRDKLYALLGISDSDAVPWDSPDYTMQVSRLFIQYTKQELISSSLAHLSATDYIDDTNQVVLPTWVPDWSRPVEHTPLEALVTFSNARGTSIPRLSFSSNNDLLIITGKRLSSVERLGTIRYSEFPTMFATVSTQIASAIDITRRELSVTQWLLDWLEDCHKTAFGDKFSPTQEMLNSKSYRRFCKVVYHDEDLKSESPSFNTIVDRLERLYLLLSRRFEVLSTARPLVNENESEILRILFDLDRYFAPYGNYRYLCADDSGRLAWVPKKTRAGDVFCVFYGAKVPHLLRPVPNGQYELIGECYLEDYMNGEVIRADEFAVEEFVLV